MSTPDTPNVIMVPVKRYDINISLDQILTPLTQMSASLAQKTAAPAPGSDLHQHVQQLSDIAHQLKDVVGRINAADSSLLAPGPTKKP